jgi:hypothetical protein
MDLDKGQIISVDKDLNQVKVTLKEKDLKNKQIKEQSHN